MKSWLNNRNLLLFGIVALTAAIYRDSFTSPFFQDDKLLLSLARKVNWLFPTAHFPYRPISIQLYYWLAQTLFGTNVLGFHLLEFLFFLGTLTFIFLLSQKLLGNSLRALTAAFFYALNVSLFANFYWIATSYFSLGALFFFSCLYFYSQTTRSAAFLTWIFFLLALGSNELTFVLPLAMLLLSWLIRFWPKRLWSFLLLTPIIVGVRTLFAGFPKVVDYTLEFNLRVLATIRWYLLRGLDLPEGVNRSSDPLIFISFLGFIAVLAGSFRKKLLSARPSLRLLVFGLGFFLIGALPFYFLPLHMSSYYLTIALFGPSLIYAEMLEGKKVLIFAVVSYLLLTIFGLQFLRETHWIILKNTGPIGQF